MAVTTEKSDVRTWETASPQTQTPVDYSSKKFAKYFKFTQGAAAGDINSTLEMVKLPGGRVRVHKHDCRFNYDAFGAARTLDVGHQAYTNRTDKTTVAAAADVIADGLDVSAAGSAAGGNAGNALTNEATKLYDSEDGVVLEGKVLGGTIPAGTVVSGVIVYSYN